jgi:hypothetical protein
MSVSLFALEIEIRVGGGHGQNLIRKLLPVLPINEPQQDSAGLGDLVEHFMMLRLLATPPSVVSAEGGAPRMGQSRRTASSCNAVARSSDKRAPTVVIMV